LKKINTLIILSLLSFSACKSNSSVKTSEQKKEGIGPVFENSKRDYTPSEVVIGRRICNALKQKRELFETLTDRQEKFRFRGEMKNCESEFPFNIAEFNTDISNASSTDFEYINTTRANYFRDVITDQTGIFKLLCDGLSQNETISNQFISGSSYVSVNLLIAESYDRAELLKKNKDSAGNYNLISTETVSFITQKIQAPTKFFGVEKERARYTKCTANPQAYSALKQTWVSAVTSF
jgi:hypothetical protein